eukprot:g2417.t1
MRHILSERNADPVVRNEGGEAREVAISELLAMTQKDIVEEKLADVDVAGLPEKKLMAEPSSIGSSTRRPQIKRLYWFIIRILRRRRRSFLFSLVRSVSEVPAEEDARKAALSEGHLQQDQENCGHSIAVAVIGLFGSYLMKRFWTQSTFADILVTTTVFAALSVLGSRAAERLSRLLFRRDALDRTSGPVDRTSTSLSRAIDEMHRLDDALRASSKTVCRAELVARGYRLGSGVSLPSVARLEISDRNRHIPLECTPLRRAIRHASRDAEREIRSATLEIERLGKRFCCGDVDDDTDARSVTQDMDDAVRSLNMSALREDLRRVRHASRLFWYTLLVNLQRCCCCSPADDGATDDIVFAWIDALGVTAETRIVATLRNLRETLELRTSGCDDETQTKNESGSAAPIRGGPTSSALRHAVREMRSHLETAATRVVLCQQQIIERLRRDADASTTAMEIVSEARRAVGDNISRTEALWTALERLAAAVDRNEDTFVKDKQVTVRKLTDGASSIDAPRDGTFEDNRPVVAAAADTASNATKTSRTAAVDVFVEEAAETEASATARSDEDDVMTTPSSFVLSESVLGDLKSAFRKDATRTERTHLVPASKKNAESLIGDDAWEVVPSASSSLFRELSDVLRKSRRPDSPRVRNDAEDGDC